MATPWLVREADETPSKGDVRSFENFLRVDPEMFMKLVAHLTPRIQKQDTNFRKALPPGLKVAITLRFLATGNSYKSLPYGFCVAPNTIVSIVPEVCRAIYDEYHEEAIKCPSTPEEWKEVAKGFSEKRNFHYVCGALGGKHVRIFEPPGSCSVYHNYKGYFSIIMLALVDADYKFMYFNVGTPGADSDAGIFRDCSLFKALDEGQANLPPPEPFPAGDQDVPYFLVGDDASTLRTWMLKPYSECQMTHAERIFNYRLSRSRLIVENIFGILANRFRYFHTMMMMGPQTVEKVVLAACSLHNMMTDIRLSGVREDPHTQEVAPGEWRQRTNQLEGMQRRGSNMLSVAKNQREDLTQHYSGVGAVPWQDKMVGPLPRQYKEQQQQEQVPDDEDLVRDVPHLDQE
ncbi:uncharacterized protein [Narcine bancroftii]|uniref:uncharacterized protein n=1 Tax=Narcine bancroftii TaxID=1343680 RepID=UPI003830FDE1